MREVLIVILKLFSSGVVTGSKQIVVILDGILKKSARVLGKGLGIEGLVVESVVIGGLVGSVGVDDGDLEPFVRCEILLLALKLVVVTAGSINRCRGENGVEAVNPLALAEGFCGATAAGGLADVRDDRVLVATRTLGLLIEMLQGVLNDLPDAFGRHEGHFGIDASNLTVFRASDSHGVVVVHTERQHVLVVDSVDDGVGVQLVSEGLLGSTQLRIARASTVGREDGRTGEAEEVVTLESAGDVGVHVTELGAVTLVEDDDDVLVVDVVVVVVANENTELLDRRDDDLGTRILKLGL